MKLDTEEVAEQANSFVVDLLGKACVNVETRLEVDAKTIKIFLTGDDSGLLLTDNGRLLYAVNHLVNQIFYRQARNGCNFFIDCNNYRSDRAAELRLMAEKAAERVRLTRSSVSLQPMPSSERRIIHLALAEEEGVRTESEGSGLHRCVLIIPTG
jgi:spoIIIJ-associated protein